MTLTICSRCHRPPATGRVYRGLCPACRAAAKGAADANHLPTGRPRLPDNPDDVPRWSVNSGELVPEGTKVCRDCGLACPLTGQHGETRNWHGRRCPACARAYKRVDYAGHKEERQAKQRDRTAAASKTDDSTERETPPAPPGVDVRQAQREAHRQAFLERVEAGRRIKRWERKRRRNRAAAAFAAKELAWAEYRQRRRSGQEQSRPDIGSPGRRPKTARRG